MLQYPPPNSTTTPFSDWYPVPINHDTTVMPVTYTYSLEPQSDFNQVGIMSFNAKPSGNDFATAIFIIIVFIMLLTLLKWSFND